MWLVISAPVLHGCAKPDLSYDCILLLLPPQYQQHPDGDGEHSVERALHPYDDERTEQRQLLRGEDGELPVLLGPLSAVLQLKS